MSACISSKHVRRERAPPITGAGHEQQSSPSKKPIAIGDLAESPGYSVSCLRAVFREWLGVSLGKYIRESRLSEAAQLLQDPSLKVTEVAERTETQYGFHHGILVGFAGNRRIRVYTILTPAGTPR